MSNQPITFDNYEYIGDVVYNGQFVHRNKNGVAELIPDIITLDENDVVNSTTVSEMDNFIQSLEEDPWYEDDDEWTEEESEEEETVPEITMTNNNNNAI